MTVITADRRITFTPVLSRAYRRALRSLRH